MFKERKYLKYKKLHKQRKRNEYYNFYGFKNKLLLKQYCIFYSLINVKLFVLHLRLLRFFFNKLTSKSKQVSRRERFKRANKKADRLERNLIKRSSFFYKKFLEFFTHVKRKDRKKLNFRYFKLNKRKKYKRKSFFLNIFMLPYTKKAVGSRMGKGKGSVKNWYFNIKNYSPIFFLEIEMNHC